jgi:predicted MPP superfamily phosphohydrolase
MRNSLVSVLLLSAIGAYFIYAISQNLQTERNDVSISIQGPDVTPTSLSIAVIADTHLREGHEPLTAFRELLLEIETAEPDLIVFVGDFIFDPSSEQLTDHRENIIDF